MEIKELKINIPEGYEIDKENSTFECIKFKPVKKSKFSDYDCTYPISGYYVYDGTTCHLPGAPNGTCHKDVFATEKYAKSALAMAQISQIIANDGRFGGVIDNEWRNYAIGKYCILRYDNKLMKDVLQHTYHLLAFHTAEQRDLFLEENEQLVKDYLMMD